MKIKIFLVDDNLLNLEVTQDMINGLGNFSIQLFENGKELIDKYSKGIRSEECDVIFMDCEMPIMDGFVTSQKIREIEIENSIPPIPIVALTAFTSQLIKNKCIQSGMDDILIKPINKMSLVNKLNQYIKHPIDINIDIKNKKEKEKEKEKEKVILFDFVNLLQQFNGNIDKIIQIFKITQRRLIDPGLVELNEAFRKKNYNEIRKISHKIKGSASVVYLLLLKKIMHKRELILVRV